MDDGSVGRFRQVTLIDTAAFQAPLGAEGGGRDGGGNAPFLRPRDLMALVCQPRPPDHDSVVVAGNGIGALTFAARLARSPEYAGKVVVAAPPISETRRLISGVSLRGRAADFIGDAIGIGTQELLASVCGAGRPLPTVHRRSSSLAQRNGDGSWQFAPARPWRERRWRIRPGAQRGATGEPALPPALAYGLRNSQIVATIWDLVSGLGIQRIEEMPRSAAEMRAMAPGSRPLLVNASSDARLLGAAPKQPAQMILASQVPFLEKPVGAVHPLQPGTAYAPLVRRQGAIDVGYFTPFADPLSPNASWYGLVTRVLPSDSSFDPYRELEAMTEALFGIGEALGLTPDDPANTLGCALVPSAPDWGSIRAAPGTLELRRAYFGGAPGFYMDGMLSAAAGGLLAARAVLSGTDPDLVVRRALRRLHWQILLRRLEATRVPLLSDRLAQVNRALAMAFPHRSVRRAWSEAAEADRIMAP